MRRPRQAWQALRRLQVEEQAIAAVIVLAVVAQLLVQGPGIWWDEAVYLGLADGLRAGVYSLDAAQPVESFRPPLLPALLAAVPFPAALPFALSLLAIVATFVLARPFGRPAALLATLFLATNTLFAFFFTKLLTESLFIVLLSLSLLVFLRDTRRGLAVAGLFAGMAFLSRYLATVLILSFLLVLIARRQGRGLVFFLIPLVAVLVPWVVLNMATYGSPFAGYFVNAGVYAASVPQSLAAGVVDILNAWTYLVLLLVAFFTIARREALGRFLPVTVLAVMSIIVYLALPHKEPRYLLSFFPAYAVLAAVGAQRLGIRRVVAPILVVSLLTLGLGINQAQHDVQAAAVVDAAAYLKTVSAPGDRILTQSYPFVYALADRTAVPYCPFPQDAFDACQQQILNDEFPLATLKETIDREHPAFALSYAYEPANPPAAREYLDAHFERIQTFAQWGDPEAVVVYQKKE